MAAIALGLRRLAYTAPRHAVAALVLGLLYSPLIALAPRMLEARARVPLALSARQWGLVGRSIGLSGAVAVTATAVGMLVALSFWRRPVLRHLRWVLVALLPVPPYFHAMAWMQAAEWTGWGSALGRGPAGAWLAQLMAYLPLSVGLSILGLELVGGRRIEAARTLRDDGQVLTRVILPLAAPSALAAAALLFVLRGYAVDSTSCSEGFALS